MTLPIQPEVQPEAQILAVNNNLTRSRNPIFGAIIDFFVKKITWLTTGDLKQLFSVLRTRNAELEDKNRELESRSSASEDRNSASEARIQALEKLVQEQQLDFIRIETDYLTTIINTQIIFLKLFLELKLKAEELLEVVKNVDGRNKDVLNRVQGAEKHLLEISWILDFSAIDFAELQKFVKTLEMQSLNLSIEAQRILENLFWSRSALLKYAEQFSEFTVSVKELSDKINKEIIPNINLNINWLISELKSIDEIVWNTELISSLQEISWVLGQLVSTNLEVVSNPQELRNRNKKLKDRVDDLDNLSPREKAVEKLKLTKNDHKIFVAELLYQVVNYNQDYKVSDHRSCALWSFIHSRDFEIIVNGLGNVAKRTYEALLTTHEEFHKKAKWINQKIKDNNAVEEGERSKISFETIVAEINNELQPLVDETLKAIDALINEINW